MIISYVCWSACGSAVCGKTEMCLISVIIMFHACTTHAVLLINCLLQCPTKVNKRNSPPELRTYINIHVDIAIID